MPRIARIESAGKHYIFNKSRAGQTIFKLPEQKAAFLDIVCAGCRRYEAHLLAYTVLDGEYHLMVETTKPNLSLLMRQVSAGYAIYFNKTVQKHTPLWHDRFASWVLFEKNDIRFIYRYMAHCPVLNNVVSEPEEYPFSSFTTQLKNKEKPECLVNSLKHKRIDAILKSSFDPDEFAVLKMIKSRARRTEKCVIKPAQKESLEKLFKKIKNREKRNKKILAAFLSGYSQNEIAQFLGLSQSSISKIVNASGRA
jgi:putative transposase